MNRQPDEPGVYVSIESERMPFRRFLWERIKDDWEANRYSVLTAICFCLTPALLILALAFLP